MGFRRKKRAETLVELTPMVDVVFLLLIFFMISTTFIETPGLTVKLPQASATLPQRQPQEVKVYLSAQGDISLGNERLSFEALRERLAGYGAEAAQLTLLLLADRDTRHGRVVQVMDAAREAGFGKLAIATETSGAKP